MTICTNCADNKGLKSIDKVAGIWPGECPYCKQNTYLMDERNDYFDPKAKRLTQNEFLAECMKELPEIDTTPLIITYNGEKERGHIRIRASIVKGTSLIDALKQIIKNEEALASGDFEETSFDEIN